MNVICKCDDFLISLLVDEIGDVVEVSPKDFRPTPSTVPPSIRRFMSGVYTVGSGLLSIIDIDQISAALADKNAA